MEKRWKKECCLPGVFCDSGDTPANLLCELLVVVSDKLFTAKPKKTIISM